MSGEDNDLSGLSGLQDAALRTVDRVIDDEVGDIVSSIQVDRDQMSAVWNRALVTALHATPIKQFGFGFGVGWLSGYLFRRVSRTAAFLLGCGFLAVQGASALGLISVNWRLLRRAAEQRISRVGRLASEAGLTSPTNSATEQVVEFCRRHGYVSSGFAAGAVVAITF